jgi:hypothetical protein
LPAQVMTTDRTSPAMSAVRITTIAVRIGLVGSVGDERGAECRRFRDCCCCQWKSTHTAPRYRVGFPRLLESALSLWCQSSCPLLRHNRR